MNRSRTIGGAPPQATQHLVEIGTVEPCLPRLRNGRRHDLWAQWITLTELNANDRVQAESAVCDEVDRRALAVMTGWCKVCGARIRCDAPGAEWEHQRPPPDDTPWEHSVVLNEHGTVL